MIMVLRMKDRSIHIVVFLLGALLLQSCDQSKLTPIPMESSILAFGDSLTLGVGVKKEKSYPSVLSELSSRNVINAGISGEMTSDGLLRFPEVIEQTDPALLILLEGGNDILRNYDKQATKSNLASMIEIAQSRGVEVVLIGVPEKNLFSDVAPIYKELAEDYQLVFEDDLIGNLLRKSAYKSDPIHFNQQGYRAMAEAIHDLLLENGGL